MDQMLWFIFLICFCFLPYYKTIWATALVRQQVLKHWTFGNVHSKDQPTLLVSLFLFASPFPFFANPRYFTHPSPERPLWIRRSFRPSLLMRRGGKAGHKAAYTYSSSFFLYWPCFVCAHVLIPNMHMYHISLFSLFLFASLSSVATYTQTPCTATWPTCYSGYWRMIWKSIHMQPAWLGWCMALPRGWMPSS